MFNKLDNLNPQTRILIAVILAFAFFVPYSYFVTPPTTPQENNQTLNQQQTAQSTNSTTAAPNASPQQNTQTPTTPQNTKKVSSDEILVQIKSDHFEMQIDRFGRIAQMNLSDSKFHNLGENLAIFAPLVSGSVRPLEIRFSDNAINDEAFKIPYEASSDTITLTDTPQKLTLTQKLSNLTITKNITFYPNGTYDLEVSLSNPFTYFITPGTRPVTEEEHFAFKGVILKDENGKIVTIEDGDAAYASYPKTPFLASVDRYYTTLLFSKGGANAFNSIVDKGANDNPLPFIQASSNLQLSGFIGPKDYRLLESIDPQLTDVVEYGIITFFAKPVFLLLDWLYSICGNWGWAIVLLTFIVRVVLYPLTYKGMVSMQKLKELAPKMKEIQEKYKGEPQKLQMHIMELYKKHGANPMGGCLPIILQMPVFFAIYRVLYNAIELKGADWILWINDLSVMDPYFVLPILMGGSMYLQQLMMPPTFNDPLQEKIFKFLPLIFTIFFITFPAGLVLYWFVNNIFSIIQQYAINKTLERKKRLEVEAHHKEREEHTRVPHKDNENK